LLSGHFARLDYRFSVAVRRSDFGSSEKRHIWLCARSKIIHYCVSEAGRRLSLLKVDTTPALQHLPSGTSIAKLSWLSAWHIRDKTYSKALARHCESPTPPALRVFALCHLLGFRFAPRIRDLADRRLYVPDKGSAYPALGNLIGTLSVRQMAAQWKEILLSAVR
jgi:Tn3 transposase DDE domain